jgi:hypothetical protein
LIASLKTEPNEFRNARSMQDIGRGLLRAAGVDEDRINDELIAAAIAANDAFIARLEQIRDDQLMRKHIDGKFTE